MAVFGCLAQLIERLLWGGARVGNLTLPGVCLNRVVTARGTFIALSQRQI